MVYNICIYYVGHIEWLFNSIINGIEESPPLNQMDEIFSTMSQKISQNFIDLRDKFQEKLENSSSYSSPNYTKVQ
jgi:hypothetical protein